MNIGSVILFVIWRLGFLKAALDGTRSYLLSENSMLFSFRRCKHFFLLNEHAWLLLHLSQALSDALAGRHLHRGEDRRVARRLFDSLARVMIATVCLGA